MTIRDAAEERRYLSVLGLRKATDVRELLGRSPRKILLVGMRALGDLLVLLPSIQAIRKTFPEAHITITSAADHRSLLDFQPGVDQFVDRPADTAAFHELARQHELAIAFRGWFPAPRILTDFPLYFVLSTDLFVGAPKPAHQHYLDALSLLGVKSRATRPRLRLSAEARNYAQRFMVAHGFPRSGVKVAVHVGSGYEGKRWPSERFEEIMIWLRSCYDARFVFIQGDGEKELVDRVRQNLDDDRVALLTEVPLMQVAAVLARCTFFVGNDTGIMHLADVVGCPSVTVFGPSRPGVWGATNRHAVHLVRPDVWWGCPFCSGRQLKDKPCCNPREPWCLQATSVEDVRGAVESLGAMIGLRARFKHLDMVKPSRNILVHRFGPGHLMLVNLEAMKPLFIQNARPWLATSLASTGQPISFERLVRVHPSALPLIEALLVYRVLIPGREEEALVTPEVRRMRTSLLTSPLLLRFGIDMACGFRNRYRQSRGPAKSAGTGKRDRLRILLVNGVPPSVYGGGERWMIRTGNSLVRRGHDVLCWGRDSHQWLAEAQRSGQVKVDARLPLAFDFRELPDITEHIKRLRIDAAVLNLDTDLAALGLPLRSAGVQRVFVRKGLPHVDREPLVRWMFANAITGIITPSRRIKAELAKQKIVPARAIAWIPNGVDSVQFRPDLRGAQIVRADLGLDQKSKILLFIGRLAQQKGLVYLLRAMPLILDRVPAARLLVVGSGPAEWDLKNEARRLDLDGTVRFLGEREDVSRMLSLADCFILPSLYEGMSTAILEAMAAGVPVVTTPVYGSRESIVSGRNGVLVRGRNPAALGQAVCDVLRGGGRRSQMARTARQYVADHHSFESMVDQVESLLAGTSPVAAGRSARGPGPRARTRSW